MIQAQNTNNIISQHTNITYLELVKKNKAASWTTKNYWELFTKATLREVLIVLQARLMRCNSLLVFDIGVKSQDLNQT